MGIPPEPPAPVESLLDEEDYAVMREEDEALRRAFQMPGNIHASEGHLSEGELWAKQIHKYRIEHDHDRAAYLAAGGELSRPYFIETELCGSGLTGAWCSEILARPEGAS